MLQIKNLALIENAEIAFGSGLNVLTGETGAGKSIVVDAISIASGSRAPKDLVRTGEDLLTVTAEFIPNNDISAWFENNGVEPEDTVIIRRTVSRDGKSSARVNGVPVAAAQLKELGSFLIDIHGQNDGRRLLDERAHLQALDAYGGNMQLLEEYGEAFKALKKIENELQAIISGETDREQRAELLKIQIEEIEEINPKSGETDDLNEQRTILLNASKLSGALDGAYEALYGGDDSDGAAALLKDAENFLESVSPYSERFVELLERARDMRYNAEDLASEIRGIRGEMDYTPEELDALEERLSALRKLTRKYGGDENAVLQWLTHAKEELENIEFSDENKQRLEIEQKKLRAEAEEKARILTEARKKSAERLRARIEDELSHLAMPGVRFETEFTENGALNTYGAEDARFLMSANAGEAPGKVAKIASGGELSRIMLALKNVLAETDPVDVMVFDEVDAGVSGIAAQRVGEKLAELACKRQVLCVTHLPQIAAIADLHFEISKSSEDGVRTKTSVNRLDEDGRVAELSRLVGGDNITETTRESAREMIKAAEAYKNQKR